MTKTELKACPFCGEKAVVIDENEDPSCDQSAWSVMCGRCYAKVAPCETKKEAAKWWNLRRRSKK